MPAKIIDGNAIAQQLKADVQLRVREWSGKGRQIQLTAIVVGASEIAGKPIALLLTEQMATVTLCHVATKDLIAHTSRAEILVVAVGKPRLISAEHVRKGSVVIDVGINRITLPDGTKKTVGDVDFEAVAPRAAYITPVPGGVGPMTVAMLLKNTVRSADILFGSLKR